MKTNIKGLGIVLTPAIKSYLEKKMEHVDKLLDPNDESIFAIIELGKTTKHHASGPVFRAEINMHMSGKDFFVVCEKDDLYAAIDEMRDEIAQDITSHRTKKKVLARKGGRLLKKNLQESE